MSIPSNLSGKQYTLTRAYCEPDTDNENNKYICKLPSIAQCQLEKAHHLTVPFMVIDGDNALKQLQSLLAKQANLKSLILIIDASVPPGKLIELLEQLKHFKCLENLNINLGPLIFSQKQLSKLTHALINLKQLKTLKLIDLEAQVNSDELCYNLQRIVTSLKQLTKLELNILGVEKNSKLEINQRLSSLILDLHNCSQLKELSGSFFVNDNLNHHRLPKFFQFELIKQDSKHKPNNLKSFKLTSQLTCSDQDLIDVLAKFERQNKLEKFYLNINNNPELTATTVATLANFLVQQTNLHALELNFKDCQNITNQGLDHLLAALDQLPNSLSELSITLNGSNFKYKQFTQLQQILAKHTMLTTLNLIFKQCSDLTDKDLIELSVNLAKPANLSNLFLDFSESANLSNAGQQHLQHTLDQLKIENATIVFPKILNHGGNYVK